MKKRLTFFISLFASSQLMAQNEVTIKAHILPNCTYYTTNIMTMQVNLDDDKESKESNQIALSNPIGLTPPPIAYHKKNNMIIKRSVDIKTWRENQPQQFNLVVCLRPTIIEESVDDKKPTIDTSEVSSKIYATGISEGVIMIDSTSNSKTITETQKELIIKMLNNTTGNVEFPNNPLKVGDSFTTTSPLNIPLNGGKNDRLLSITYKLMKIENNLLYFDLTEFMNSETADKLTLKTVDKVTINISGGGYGKLIYDFDRNYIVSNHSVLNFTYTVNVNSENGRRGLQGTLKMENEIRTVIKPTK